MPRPTSRIFTILEGKTKGECEEAIKTLEEGGAKCEMRHRPRSLTLIFLKSAASGGGRRTSRDARRKERGE